MASDTSISRASLEIQVAAVVARVDMLVNELKDFKDEMRGRDNQRANEIAELRGTFQTIQNTLMQMQTSNRNQNVLVIIGVIAIAVAVFLK